MAVPTQARLLQLFNFDPDSGRLVWRDRPRTNFRTEAAYRSFCVRCRGHEAGSIEANGYRKVSIGAGQFKVHKLVWLMSFGEWPAYPDFEIDHINGIRSDNRLTNLRKVTKSGNQRNAGKRRNNTSGVHGVNRKGKNWVARIWNGPRHVYLGQFETLHEAEIARKAAERVLGFTGSDRTAR